MSHAYLIEGGRPLHGEVTCSGAKNSALKLLAASLLATGTHTLGRVPEMADVVSMAEVLKHLGADVVREPDGELKISVPEKLGTEAPYEFVSRMRASTAVLGPLLAREGRARVALPGGCNLGPRRIDLHLKGLEQLGADIRVVHGFVEATCTRLRGAVVNLDFPSHGATENLLMAGVLAEGRTIIENAARDPEIRDLATFLKRMGAHVEGAGTNVIEIEGVDGLRAASLDVMPDRLEAGTFLLAVRATGGDVVVSEFDPSTLEIVLTKLEETGALLDVGSDRVRIRAEGRPKATDISTLPYPGFPTDLQPIAVAALCMSDGLSIVTENIFDARFFYTDELARMGADVRVEGHYAVVRGAEELLGAPVRAPDIRAGAALVVAGIAAKGRTIVEDIIHIDRGHENLDGKLAGLGADIRRVSAPVPSPA
jgi:UDP-N-acetylglucosamine 1-carboxyvinyltransferase